MNWMPGQVIISILVTSWSPNTVLTKHIKKHSGTSLVVQWLRIRLVMQGTPVWSLVRELRSLVPQSCLGREPQQESPRASTTEFTCSGAHTPQLEKSLCTATKSPLQQKILCAATKTQWSQKINKYYKNKNKNKKTFNTYLLDWIL